MYGVRAVDDDVACDRRLPCGRVRRGGGDVGQAAALGVAEDQRRIGCELRGAHGLPSRWAHENWVQAEGTNISRLFAARAAGHRAVEDEHAGRTRWAARGEA